FHRMGHDHLGDAEKPFVSAPDLISPAPSDIVSATLGHQHTIFLDSSGTVSRLGSNKKPLLDGIDAAGTYTTGDGDAWELLIAGNNASGQLGRDGGELLRASTFCDGSATVSGVWERARSRVFRSFAFIHNGSGGLGLGVE
ncbi:hypothetical protein B0H14DRAFT_2863452, partial [Mycena olivaceomarginata]